MGRLDRIRIDIAPDLAGDVAQGRQPEDLRREGGVAGRLRREEAAQPRGQGLPGGDESVEVAGVATGLDEGATAQVEVGLRRDGQELVRKGATVGAGVATIPLPLAGARPGMCEAWARVAGSDRTLTQPVRVVSSPWEVAQP